MGAPDLGPHAHQGVLEEGGGHEGLGLEALGSGWVIRMVGIIIICKHKQPLLQLTSVRL